MKFIIPFVFYFISSVSCIPFFSLYKRLFNTECGNYIQHELDLNQGFKPDMTNSANYGYIYQLNTPTTNMSPDLSIKETDGLPSQVVAVLSSFTLDDSKLIMKGRISKLNADRLQSVPLQSMMKFQFNIFGGVALGTTGDITGTVNNMDIIEQEDTTLELIMELTPTTSTGEYIEYSESPNSVKQLAWNSLKPSCKSSKRDQFHEIIDSAVLL